MLIAPVFLSLIHIYVGGLRSANEGKALTKILDELKAAGYTITPHLYKFEEYGIPQARHRLIIVGIRNDIDVQFKIPSPAPYADVDNTCRNAIENPPIPEDAFNNEATKQSKQVVERLKHIKPGENAFTADSVSYTHLIPLLVDSIFLRIRSRSRSISAAEIFALPNLWKLRIVSSAVSFASARIACAFSFASLRIRSRCSSSFSCFFCVS